MSEREPFWYCHQCHAEMRPLMIPDPICASCRSSFVEMLENPSDDPRGFQIRAPDAFDAPNIFPGASEGFFRTAGWRSTGSSSPLRSRSPPTQRTHDNSGTSGLHFEFHSGPGGGSTRTFILGGPNTLGRSSPQADLPMPPLFDLLRRESENNMRPPGDITGQLMAQYLLAMLGREPHRHGDRDPFAEVLGMPPSARWGDYVFNQEALDQILAQIAENSPGGRPTPASEDIISNLPREVLTEGSPLLEKDCAVCKESFKLDAEDPDELVIVTLPCKHSFHEGCILPWLKSSGTCPVCRHSLVTQSQQPQQPQSPGGPSGGSSGSDNRANSSSSGPRTRSPGSSDRSGGGGFFHSLFGGGAGTSSGSSDGYPSRSRRIPRRGNHESRSGRVSRTTPSFPGQWVEDIDS